MEHQLWSNKRKYESPAPASTTDHNGKRGLVLRAEYTHFVEYLSLKPLAASPRLCVEAAMDIEGMSCEPAQENARDKRLEQYWVRTRVRGHADYRLID